jgi:hypothetical protein
MNKKDKMFILVNEWEESGVTKSNFAISKGLSYHGFNYWVRVYRRELKEKDSKVKFFNLPEQVKPSSGNFIPKNTIYPINPKPQILLELSSGLKITIY